MKLSPEWTHNSSYYMALAHTFLLIYFSVLMSCGSCVVENNSINFCIYYVLIRFCSFVVIMLYELQASRFFNATLALLYHNNAICYMGLHFNWCHTAKVLILFQVQLCSCWLEWRNYFFFVSETCWNSDQYILHLYKLKRH